MPTHSVREGPIMVYGENTTGIGKSMAGLFPKKTFVSSSYGRSQNHPLVAQTSRRMLFLRWNPVQEKPQGKGLSFRSMSR